MRGNVINNRNVLYYIGIEDSHSEHMNLILWFDLDVMIFLIIRIITHLPFASFKVRPIVQIAFI